MPTVTSPTPMTATSLVVRGSTALGLTYKQLSDVTRSSERTVARWMAGHSTPGEHQYRKLAALLQPVDADLAAEALRHCNAARTVLGWPAVGPAPVASGPTVSAQLLVETVVCAAAEASEPFSLTIKAAREVVRAAFTRARDVGLDVNQVIEALTPAALEEGHNRKARRREAVKRV